MRRNIQIAARFALRVMGLPVGPEGETEGEFTATEQDIDAATEALTPLRSALGQEAAANGIGTDVYQIDPYAATMAVGNARALAKDPEVAKATGTDDKQLTTLVEQQREMLSTYETTVEMDGDLSVSETVIEQVEAREQKRLITGVQRIIAEGRPGDPLIIQLKSDAADMLSIFDEQGKAKIDQLKLTNTQKKAAATHVVGQQKKTRMLKTMIDLKRGQKPSQKDLSDLVSTLDEINGTADPVAAANPANRRGSGR